MKTLTTLTSKYLFIPIRVAEVHELDTQFRLSTLPRNQSKNYLNTSNYIFRRKNRLISIADERQFLEICCPNITLL